MAIKGQPFTDPRRASHLVHDGEFKELLFLDFEIQHNEAVGLQIFDKQPSVVGSHEANPCQNPVRAESGIRAVTFVTNPPTWIFLLDSLDTNDYADSLY